MPTTSNRGYPIVAAGSIPDGASQVNALAVAVDADVAALASGYRLAAVLVLVAGTTFAKATYPGLKAVDVEVVGGGGGSGGIQTTSSIQASTGDPGGGAGYAKSFLTAAQLSATETVTVGAAGAAGTGGSSATNGGDGGTTSFGTHVSATGGKGGTHTRGASSGLVLASNGSLGGHGTVTDGVGIAADGDQADGALWVNATIGALSVTARGGRSGGPYGQVVAVGSSGLNGYGSGASGNFAGPSTSGFNGTAGQPGVCTVRVYI